MEDFTGGLAESIDLKKAPADLFKTITKALAKSSLMGCSLNVSLKLLDTHQNRC